MKRAVSKRITLRNFHQTPSDSNALPPPHATDRLGDWAAAYRLRLVLDDAAGFWRNMEAIDWDDRLRAGLLGYWLWSVGWKERLANVSFHNPRLAVADGSGGFGGRMVGRSSKTGSRISSELESPM